MTKANLLIMGKRAVLETDLTSNTSSMDNGFFKSKSFEIDNTFQKSLIHYLVENKIRITKTEKLY